MNALLAQARSGGLDKAAAAKGLQVITTDFVSRTDTLPGIGSSPQFMGAVFGQAEKSPPDQVQMPQGYAVFEVTGDQAGRRRRRSKKFAAGWKRNSRTSALPRCWLRRRRNCPIAPRPSMI